MSESPSMIKLFLAELLGSSVFYSTILFTVDNTKKKYYKENAWIIIGLSLSIMIAVFANISGSHFNPCVSLFFYLNEQLSLENLGVYVVAQTIAAILAVTLFKFYKPQLTE